jgi:DNA-binding response OmpR family regulator
VYVSQQQLQPRRLHILLVDSDLHVRDKVQQALGNGCVLRFARSLEEAQHSLDESTPDVLICEVELPNASGLDLCQYARRSPALRHLPIMFLTTLSTLQDKIAGFDAGADDYVVKPFDARHLLARIRLLARIKRLEYERD